ncbi:hypothetical protein OH76DRAFT_1419632 [Lentinus brumalis]|uniref:Uncharacterized protein n=1 Tax=Lentinus brumalis TaxID=2498619 RepID=A0A371D4B8_9APHY|nr:hypothetical protein OH76DRAFT_1419632 [Polyporus brumalis]
MHRKLWLGVFKVVTLEERRYAQATCDWLGSRLLEGTSKSVDVTAVHVHSQVAGREVMHVVDALKTDYLEAVYLETDRHAHAPAGREVNAGPKTVIRLSYLEEGHGATRKVAHLRHWKDAPAEDALYGERLVRGAPASTAPDHNGGEGQSDERYVVNAVTGFGRTAQDYVESDKEMRRLLVRTRHPAVAPEVHAISGVESELRFYNERQRLLLNGADAQPRKRAAK